MFELRTLGPVDLRAPDGRLLQSVLAQPKRSALLAYLCVASAQGFQRRDALIPLFWPEADRERSRNALRQSLHFLRRSLSSGIIRTCGDEELAVASEEIWCDAVALDQAVARGDLEEAAELYRGEFLAGLHLTDAPEFESWLTLERARLQSRAKDAVRGLAEARMGAGDEAGALAWWRRLAEIDPLDSRAALHLARALADGGDRVGALRQADLHTRMLREQLGMDGDREVRALADELRRDGEAAAPRPEPQPAPPSPEPALAPAPGAVEAPAAELEAGSAPPTPAPAASGDRPRPLRRFAGPRARRLSLAGAAVAAAVVSLALVFGRVAGDGEANASTSAAGELVAVLPFAVRGAPDLEYLGEGMVDLLGPQLNTAGELRSVDARAVLGAASGVDPSALDPGRGRALAEELGADLFVMGSIVEVEGRLRVSASLYDRGGTVRARSDVAAAHRREVFEVIDRMAAQLLTRRMSLSGGRMARLAAGTTASLPAVKAYVRGERLFREQRYGASMQALQEALQQDSTFALAAYRLSVVADWVGDNAVAQDAIALAARHADRLPQVERLMVDALVAFGSNAPAEAKRLYGAVILRQPSHAEAWYRLAETEYHHNPLLGLSPEGSAASFRRVLALDPGHLPARAHLVRLAAQAGDERGFDSLVVPLVAGSPADSLRWMHLRALAFRDARALARLAGARDTVADDLLWSLAEDAAIYGGDPAAASAVARDLLAPRRAPELQTAGHLLLAWLDVARGRPAAADRHLARVAVRDPAIALEYRALFASVEFVPVPRERLRALRDSVAAWEVTGEENPYLGLYTDMWPSVRTYLTGLLSARLGDAEDVERRVALLAPSPTASAEARAMLAGRSDAIRARLAAGRGDPARALMLLEGHPDAGALAPRSDRVNLFQRQLRPELLNALGRSGEALRWYAATPWRGDAYVEEVLWDLVHLAPAHRQRARILEKLGREEEAAAEYARFAELWRDAEPPLRAQVEQAERRLAALGR